MHDDVLDILREANPALCGCRVPEEDHLVDVDLRLRVWVRQHPSVTTYDPWELGTQIAAIILAEDPHFIFEGISTVTRAYDGEVLLDAVS